MKGFIRKNIIGLCRLRTILVSLLFFFTLFTARAIAVDYYWTATDSTARIELDSRLMNGWFFNGSYEFRDRDDLSNENSINLKAVRYF